LTVTDKTPEYLNVIEVAGALDVSTVELAVRRKIGALPEPVAVQLTGGRPRFLWSRAEIAAFKIAEDARLKPAAE